MVQFHEAYLGAHRRIHLRQRWFLNDLLDMQPKTRWFFLVPVVFAGCAAITIEALQRRRFQWPFGGPFASEATPIWATQVSFFSIWFFAIFGELQPHSVKIHERRLNLETYRDIILIYFLKKVCSIAYIWEHSPRSRWRAPLAHL